MDAYKPKTLNIEEIINDDMSENEKYDVEESIEDDKTRQCRRRKYDTQRSITVNESAEDILSQYK